MGSHERFLEQHDSNTAECNLAQWLLHDEARLAFMQIHVDRHRSWYHTTKFGSYQAFLLDETIIEGYATLKRVMNLQI